MPDDAGYAHLVPAGRLLAESWQQLRFATDVEEITGKLAEAGRLYDAVTRQAAPGDTETAPTVAIGRSTIAAFALRLCVDVDHDLGTGCDWDDEGPPVGEMEWDEERVSAAFAEQAVVAAQASLDADPDDSLVPVQLGHARAWIGDRQGAAAAYEEALRRDPWDGAARWCLERLGMNTPEPPPAEPVSRRPYGFAVLNEAHLFTDSDTVDEGLLFGSLADVRAYADAELRDPGGLAEGILRDGRFLELEIHLPGKAVTTYDLIARVPARAANAGSFHIDWSGIPIDAPMESPLPPGRILRIDGRPCFYASLSRPSPF